MAKEGKYTIQKVTYIKQWTDHLFSFKITRDESFKFIPGQFARLGVKKEDETIVWRPYSIVSADYDEELEFYSIVVPDGEFTQRLKNIKINDDIYIDKTNYGLLTTDRFENGKDLWFLSTGTGLAPFISIMYDFSVWEQYDKVILVHCTRLSEELTYQETINEFFTHEYYGELVKDKLKYVKITTREKNEADLYGRITDLIVNKELEDFVGIPFTVENSRVMICGNPQMVDDTRRLLAERGLTISRRGNPGNMAVENYW
ncbi:ferredoxin--NADP reductase [Aquella oligotrophica]|uniref:ferredoxin--NADP(+) reductase n=1 Tax=Aquella oligotrophica TaxID=2067065 RepID=A0A2I7N365_9NEIS|nr:ferredoxin--NADP reductase [Aquella oligotrophica]AUR50893.1 ferredoxin--NADP(+) reductase [Aquella oligotrophica]